MARTTLTDRHRSDQAARLAELERAHAASGIAKPKAALDKAAAFFRAKCTTREVQAVFDEVVSQAPGPATLSLVAAVMCAQAAEQARLTKQLREAKGRAKGDKKGDAADEAEAIGEHLQELRRATRSLKLVTDVVLKAVKVQSELRLSGAPNAIEVTGTDTARERLTALPQ